MISNNICNRIHKGHLVMHIVSIQRMFQIGGEGRRGRNDGGNQQTFWAKSSCDSNGCCIIEYTFAIM